MSRPAELPAFARPRLGFLGVGWIGRHRMEAILGTDVAEIAAIADPSQDMATEAQKLAPEAELGKSLDDLLALGLDGIVIATPSALHAEQATRALEAGAAVFCQKPLGRNAAEVRRVVDAARQADRLLAVDLSYRHTEAMVKITELVRSGTLGEVYAADLVFHNAYGPDKAWFYDPALSGGGCVMDLGIHLVDLALWLFDFPAVKHVSSNLFAQGQPLQSRNQVEDYAEVILELETGAIVRIACSWRLPVGRDAVIAVNIYGTAGGAAMHNLDGSFYDFLAEHNQGTTRSTLASPPDDWGGGAAVAWASRLAAGQRFDPQADLFVQSASIIDRIYKPRGPMGPPSL
ncbi:MAG: Gfo/Idh/MocA family protein [Allosphingosinicella sp.]|uniref:Gfo/Idh/MocA family protein n=1 Tax=Allosphingosinicella sp. TaxID=2823234 RepID=UPI003940DF86